MKILHVLSSPHLGGAEWMCLHLASTQSATHSVVLLVFVPGRVSEQAKKLGIDIVVAPGAPPAVGRLARRRDAALALRTTVAAERPDLVHSHVPLTNLICHKVLRRSSVPWVATIHGSWRQFAYGPQTVGRPYLRPYAALRHAVGDRLVTRSAARLVAPSDYVRRELRTIGIRDSRIVTIINGLPPAARSVPKEAARAQLGLPLQALIVGSLGYFAPVKGFDLLIAAFARICSCHTDLRLVIAGGDVLGDTRTRDKLEAMIRRLGIAECVQLLGGVDPQDSFLSALDVFVVSSRTEGLPLALLEAMYHSLPSVVTSEGGCSEAARPDEEALVFQSGSVASLAGAIERLVLDSGLRQKLGRAANQRVITDLTLPRCVAEYEQLYAQIVGQPSGAK